MSFEHSLREGLLGESIIVRWLNRQGCHVLPANEIEQSHGKGPRLYTAKEQLISPDLLCWNGREQFWIEAKTKSAFTWHRLSETWQTGIDRRHWHHYQRVEETMGTVTAKFTATVRPHFEVETFKYERRSFSR